jgi:hypothetical protein
MFRHRRRESSASSTSPVAAGSSRLNTTPPSVTLWSPPSGTPTGASGARLWRTCNSESTPPAATPAGPSSTRSRFVSQTRWPRRALLTPSCDPNSFWTGSWRASTRVGSTPFSGAWSNYDFSSTSSATRHLLPVVAYRHRRFTRPADVRRPRLLRDADSRRRSARRRVRQRRRVEPLPGTGAARPRVLGGRSGAGEGVRNDADRGRCAREDDRIVCA